MDKNKIENEDGTFYEVLPPNFFIQEKIGTTAHKIISPESIKIAEKCIESLKPTILHALDIMLHDISTLARVRPRGVAPQIWRKAHEIRGIAGSANRYLVGNFCNLLCCYLDDADEHFKPNVDLITDLSVAAINAMSEGADADADLLSLFEECKIAVEKQKTREGRSDCL